MLGHVVVIESQDIFQVFESHLCNEACEWLELCVFVEFLIMTASSSTALGESASFFYLGPGASNFSLVWLREAKSHKRTRRYKSRSYACLVYPDLIAVTNFPEFI